MKKTALLLILLLAGSFVSSVRLRASQVVSLTEEQRGAAAAAIVRGFVVDVRDQTEVASSRPHVRFTA